MELLPGNAREEWNLVRGEERGDTVYNNDSNDNNIKINWLYIYIARADKLGKTQ